MSKVSRFSPFSNSRLDELVKSINTFPVLREHGLDNEIFLKIGLAPGYTWKAGLKLTIIKLDFIKDKELSLHLENNIRGGVSSVMGDRYVQSDDKKQILYMLRIIFMHEK